MIAAILKSDDALFRQVVGSFAFSCDFGALLSFVAEVTIYSVGGPLCDHSGSLTRSHVELQESVTKWQEKFGKPLCKVTKKESRTLAAWTCCML